MISFFFRHVRRAESFRTSRSNALSANASGLFVNTDRNAARHFVPMGQVVPSARARGKGTGVRRTRLARYIRRSASASRRARLMTIFRTERGADTDIGAFARRKPSGPRLTTTLSSAASFPGMSSARAGHYQHKLIAAHTCDVIVFAAAFPHAGRETSLRIGAFSGRNDH